MRTSFGPNRSSGLRIEGRPIEEFKSRRTDSGSGSLATMVDRAPQADHLSSSGKEREILVRLGTLMGPNI